MGFGIGLFAAPRRRAVSGLGAMSELELRDQILKHSLQILRLSAGEQAEVDAVIRQLSGELKTLLQSQVLSEAGKRQIEALIKDAEGLIGKAYKTAGASADTHAIAMVIADKTVEALAELGPSALAPSPERLASLTKDVLIDGAPSSAWWTRQAEDTAFKFAGQVRQGVINGETNERIVQRIVGRQGEPGILDVSRRNARTLVHSSIMSAMNESRLATYRKNGRFIKGVRWLATLDGITCNRCAALDGNAWDLNGKAIDGTKVNFMAPPIHFGDRCILSPIPNNTLGLDMGKDTRASAQGPITGDTSFDAFLKRLTPAQIELQFGKGRAELLRSGRITVKDLVSGAGRELTLDELRALN
jgi:Phage Mu protein F like protein